MVVLALKIFPNLDAGYLEKLDILDRYFTPPTLITTVLQWFLFISDRFSSSVFLIGAFSNVLLIVLYFKLSSFSFLSFVFSLSGSNAESSSVSLSSGLDKINGRFSSSARSVLAVSARSVSAATFEKVVNWFY